MAEARSSQLQRGADHGLRLPQEEFWPGRGRGNREFLGDAEAAGWSQEPQGLWLRQEWPEAQDVQGGCGGSARLLPDAGI